MSLSASKLQGITSDENASAVDLLQKKKEMEKPAPPPVVNSDNLLENQKQLETDIAGSNDLWGSQFEVEHLASKVTKPKDYKTPQ